MDLANNSGNIIGMRKNGDSDGFFVLWFFVVRVHGIERDRM